MTTSSIETEITVPYEEEYQHYTISIDNNPDQYRGGHVWEVSKDGEVIDSDIEFSVEAALISAKTTVERLNSDQENSVMTNSVQ